MSQHDLPLPDYDGLPLGSIESRIRMLDVEGVETGQPIATAYLRRVENGRPSLPSFTARGPC